MSRNPGIGAPSLLGVSDVAEILAALDFLRTHELTTTQLALGDVLLCPDAADGVLIARIENIGSHVLDGPTGAVRITTTVGTFSAIPSDRHLVASRITDPERRS